MLADERTRALPPRHGGYGLFGIITELDVDAAPNLALEPSIAEIDADRFAPEFVTAVHSAGVDMAYGRLSVSRAAFLQRAVLVRFQSRSETPGALRPTPLKDLRRFVYRLQEGSEYGKRVRWFAETRLGRHFAPSVLSRNTILSEPAANLARRNPRRTDILHEYFVPPTRFADFLGGARRIINHNEAELLNVTLRYVEPDMLSILSYAPGPRIAAVMSFSQVKAAEADIAMRAMTEELVEHVLGLGGSFYLPYRTHARRDQLDRAYPKVASFEEAKRRYDPGRLFRNGLWSAYFE